MDYLYFVPKWFVIYGLGLEFMFSIVTLLVGIYSLKVYHISKNKDIKTFGIGFLLISLSYIIWLFLNFFSLIEINEGTKVLELKEAFNIINIGAYAHIFLFIIGLITLIYATLKFKDYKTFLLLSIVSIFSIIFSTNKSLLFYIISAIFLLYLAIHYLNEYRIKNNSRLAITFSAFTLLFVGSIEIIRSKLNIINYAVGHFLILIAYILILINIIKIAKNGKKTK